MPLIPPKQWFDEKGTQHYDLDVPGLQAFVEVKGASNNDQLKLFDDQLDSQLGELGFPVEDGFVWIFSYRNRENHQGKRRRSRCLKRDSGKSWDSLSEFLARNISFAYLIDVRLLSLLRGQNGIQPYARDRFNLRCIVRLNRTRLKELAQNAREGLQALGVAQGLLPRWLPPKAKRFLPRTIDTNFDGRKISFTLTILTQNGFKNRFLRRLNGTVKRSESS
jgi:hypothetical protein